MATSKIRQSGINYKNLTRKYEGTVGVTQVVFNGVAQNDGVVKVGCTLSADGWAFCRLAVDDTDVFSFGTVQYPITNHYMDYTLPVSKGSTVKLTANQASVALDSNITFA